jgi:hypothetical protein
MGDHFVALGLLITSRYERSERWEYVSASQSWYG